jgi:hypothetical protein
MPLFAPTLFGWQLCDVPVWDGVRTVEPFSMILQFLYLASSSGLSGSRGPKDLGACCMTSYNQ